MTNPEREQHLPDQESIKILADAVSAAIKDNKGDQRFIDLARLPLICLAIANQAKSTEELKKRFLEALDELKKMIASNRAEADKQHDLYLTKESFVQQFTPVKNFVYGMIGIICSTILGWVLLKAR